MRIDWRPPCEARHVQYNANRLIFRSTLVWSAEAKNLDINISRIAEESIARAVSEEKARLWKIENRETIEAWNEWVERNGLPLAEFRQF